MIGIQDIMAGNRINAEKAEDDRITGAALRGSDQPGRPADFQKALEEALVDKADSKKKPVDKKLMDVCVEMESLFVAKMFTEMRKTVHKSPWIHGGFAEDIFEDMLYDEYALNLSKNSNLGLAKMLYNEMSRKM